MKKEDLIKMLAENETLRDVFRRKIEFHIGYHFRFDTEMFELIDSRLEIKEISVGVFEIFEGQNSIVRLFVPDRIGDNGENIIGEYDPLPFVTIPRILRG